MTQPWPGLQPRHSLLTFSNGWRIKESCCDRLALQRYLPCGVIPSVLHLRESLTKAPFLLHNCSAWCREPRGMHVGSGGWWVASRGAGLYSR